MAKVEVDKIVNEIKDLIAQTADAKNWIDYVRLTNKAVEHAMVIAQDFADKSGAEKKEYVVETFRVVYKELDPDLPFVDGPFEVAIEQEILKRYLPIAIDQAWEYYKKFSEKGEK